MSRYTFIVISIGLMGVVSGCTVPNSIRNGFDQDHSVSTVENTAEAQLSSFPDQFPDQAVAYVTDNHIWISNSDGTDARRLPAEHSQSELSPVWSADHTKLIYVAHTTEEFYEIRFFMPATGQEITLIAGREQPFALQPSPNGTHLMYQVGTNLFVLDMETQERTRIHEGVQSAAWSFTGKQFVFATTDNRLLLQDYSLKGEFSDPVTVLEQAVSAPVFVKAHVLAFETAWDDEYTAVTYNMQTQELEPISNLRFTSLEPTTRLTLEPLGTRLLYVRTDDITSLPNVWVIDTGHSEPQLILTNAAHAVWSEPQDHIYYVVEKNDADDNLVRTVYTATAAGLQKTELVTQADSVVSQVTIMSNEMQ